MKIQINQVGKENQHVTIEQGCVYVELNGYTYYFDGNEDETTILRWETDSEEGIEEPNDWKDVSKVEFKFLVQ
jgi:hypothetical protein